jgi:hypothetical protein
VLCVYRLVAPEPAADSGWRQRPVANAAALLLFFVVTCYGWLIFRASSIAQVGRFTRVLFTQGDLAFFTAIKEPTPPAQAGLCVLLAFETLEYLAGSRTFYRAWPRPVRGAFYAAVAFILVMGFSNETAQFIYFQF